jgi:hypothetical protein
VAAEVKKFEEKARALFQSDNEKTTEIKYRPSTTLHHRADSLQLKTLKNRDFYHGPVSDRMGDKPSDLVIEFKEKIKIRVKGETQVSREGNQPSQTLFKNRSLCDDENCLPSAKASKSEGKQPAKVGVSL